MNAVQKLIQAADNVVANWEKGSLARSVRELSAAVEEAKMKVAARSKVRLVVELHGGCIECVRDDRPDLDIDTVVLEDPKYVEREEEDRLVEFGVWKGRTVLAHLESDTASAASFDPVFRAAEERDKAMGKVV